MKEITELSELKEIELNIVNIVHEFCIEKNIKYYLAYGTLIGAIRHKGFIPWDDDIDIWMFREDYERFINEFPQYANDKNLYIVNKDTNPCYLRYFSKVCDKRTLLIEKEFDYAEDIGVFVDIWPLDFTSKYNLIKKVHKQILHSLNSLFYNALIKGEDYKGNIFKRVLRIVIRKFGIDRILKIKDNVCKLYRNKYSCHIINLGYKCWEFKTSDFDEPVLVDFENTKLFIPNGYDNILKSIYGDYLKLPPEEKQKPHHIANIYWK